MENQLEHALGKPQVRSAASAGLTKKALRRCWTRQLMLVVTSTSSKRAAP